MFRPVLQRSFRLYKPSQILTKSRWQLSQQLRFQSVQAVKQKEPSKIQKLVKNYGYSALGIYLFLSALDLPLCYLLVHSMGKEEIQIYENKVKQYFGYGKSDQELEKIQQIDRIEEASEPKTEDGLFSWFSWTEFAVAYGIHKTVLIFVRVPLTAALTPWVVKTLQGWGFRIGAAAVVPRFGTRATNKKRWFSWFF